MDFREYENKKNQSNSDKTISKENKIEKVKKATAGAIVAATLISGFAFAKSENKGMQKVCDKIFTAKIERNNEYFEGIEYKVGQRNKSFDDMTRVDVVSQNDVYSAIFYDQDVDMVYSISQEQFQEISGYIKNLQDKSDIELNENGFVIFATAIKNKNLELSEMLYNIVKNNDLLREVDKTQIQER